MNFLLTGAFKYTEEQILQIKKYADDLVYIEDERKNVSQDISRIEYAICNNLFIYNKIENFKNLKCIQLTSTGIEKVPLNYIKDNKIKLFNAHNIYSIPMSEWAILKILEIYKRSSLFYELQKICKWEKRRDLFELTDKIVTIIGFGNIGIEIAKRIKSFGCKIISVSRNNSSCDMVDESYRTEMIDKVLELSDIVILTLPLNKNTYKMINRRKLKKMKNDSILINLSRGKVIDESALIDELENGKFLGVALDVFENEPLSKKSKLWNFKNVIISPHVSYISEKVNNRMFDLIINRVKVWHFEDKKLKK